MNCINCNQEIPDGVKFCNHCGKKQVQKYVKVFNKLNMSNDAFILLINQWIADNPKIANVKCEFNSSSEFGLLSNKYVLDSVVLKYELFESDNKNQYALVELSKLGFYHKSAKDMLNEWKMHNPNAVVLKTSGGSNSRGYVGHSLLGGVGAINNTNYLFSSNLKNN